MTDAYFDRSHLPKFPTVGRGSPKLAEQFFAYYGNVFADGELSMRMKSLTALAVAHAVQCPYCIDAYTADSLEKGADISQMTEAVHVAALVKSGAVLTYGVQMMSLASSKTGGASSTVSDAYFSRKHLEDQGILSDGAPGLMDAFRGWQEAVMANDELTVKEKATIAVAIAHTIQNPYEIERSSKLAMLKGASLEQLTEAIHVAVAIRGGASLVHAVQMLEQIDHKGMA